MNAKIHEIAQGIAELERQLEQSLTDELEEKRREFRYAVEQGRIAFEAEARQFHKKMRQGVPAFLWDAPVLNLLVAPVIYSLIVPLALLDAWIWLYQAVCFPVYGIARVERARYMPMDRSSLRYLNAVEQFNCNYCSYANGLVAYAREVAARTEQYFCPIKHARRRIGVHSRYHDFFDFGDAKAYRNELITLRAKLKPGV
jgi:hypothetical protein